jgi:sigma-B regulation protein RsbU (phosphoserine phosphatase)
VATFDLEARTLTYTNAGHPPGLLVSEGGVRLFDAGGPPAGLLPCPEYAEEQVLLRDGDIGALFTDGVTESLDGDREALVALLAAARGAQPSPDAIAIALLAAASRAGGPAGIERWEDDCMVMAFVVGPPPMNDATE